MDTNYNTNVQGALSLITVNGSTYQIGKDATSSVGGIMKLYTSVGGQNDTNTDGAVSQSALTTALSNLTSGSTLSVEKDGQAASNPTISADGSTYAVKQGSNTLFSINVARDMVVSDGEVITADGTEMTTTNGSTSAGLTSGEKYIKLQLANSNKLLYIPVDSLYKDYTFSDTTEIDFTDTNNTITAEIKTGSIAASKLDSSVQASLALADSALQSHQDISGKANKLTVGTGAGEAIAGNFMSISAAGDIADSGYAASDFQVAGNYKTTQSAVTDPTVGSSTTTYQFIASVSQDANGEITATKEAVRSASASQSGLMSAADYSKLAAISASVSDSTLTITTVAAA